jgi:hypothetical protein
MHRHEMQQSNVYLGIYTIEYYFLLEKSGCYKEQALRKPLLGQLELIVFP